MLRYLELLLRFDANFDWSLVCADRRPYASGGGAVLDEFARCTTQITLFFRCR